MLKSEVSSSPQTPIAVIVPAPTATVVDSNPLLAAQAALQEAIQKCQDPSLSDVEKSQILLSAQTTLQEAASLLASGATAAPAVPDAKQETVPAAPPPVAEEKKAVFSTKNDDLLKDMLFKLKDASGDAKFGLKQSLEKEKAQELMELLPQMRQALLEEIDVAPVTDSAIPVKEPKNNPEVLTLDNDTNPSGGSKWKDMLSRAKAAKADQS